MSRGTQASTAKSRSEESGREAIMDTAERLFAERGIDAVSLRTINAEAGYSVAALHYHFSTRDGLVRALIGRAQPPMLEQRAAMLAVLDKQPQPRLSDIVDALIRPLAVGMAEEPFASVRRLRFLTRLFFDRSHYLARTLEEGLELFIPLLQRALPRLDTCTLTRRWLFAAEIAQHALTNALELHLESAAGSPDPDAFERLLHDLREFIMGGLERP